MSSKRFFQIVAFLVIFLLLLSPTAAQNNPNTTITSALVGHPEINFDYNPVQRGELFGSGSPGLTTTFVQGVPGTPVDIYANGYLVARNVQPKTILGPGQLPPGQYHVKIVAAGGNPANPLTEFTQVFGPDGFDNFDIVFGLFIFPPFTTARPGAAFFPVIAPPEPGLSVISLRHMADAPPISLVEWPGTPNEREALRVNNGSAGFHYPQIGPVVFSIRLTDTGETLIPPSSVILQPKTFYSVYFIGSQAQGTLDFFWRVVHFN